jgi:hypothetical protein
LNWSQILDASGYLPSQFVQPFDPNDTSANPSGPVFHGMIETGPPTDWPVAYRERGRLITITLTWTNSDGSKSLVHQRQVQTCVGRYGMQSYVSSP